MNDAAIQRSAIERIDWSHLIHVLGVHGALVDSSVISPDGIQHTAHRAIAHSVLDRRRKVIQRVTVTLTEEVA